MDKVMQFYKTKLGKDFHKLRCKLWAIQAMGSSDKDSHPFVKQLKTKTIVDMFDAFEIVAHQANDLVTRIQDQVEELSSEKKENQ
jgi:hypothetical protein